MRLLFFSSSRGHLLLRRYPLLVALVALVGASLLMLVNAPRALACPVCISPDKVTVSGDGISGNREIADASLLGSLGAGVFMGFEKPAPVVAPGHTGNGYELVRYFKNSGVPDSFWTQGFDHMRYYPGVSGQPGYIYYEGPVSDEASRYAQGLDMPPSGRWFQMTATQDDVLRQLLTAAHANLRNNSAASQPPTTTEPSNGALTGIPLPVIILLACLVLLAAAVGYRVWYLRRHRVPFSPAEETGD
jgi:hypothetical protein